MNFATKIAALALTFGIFSSHTQAGPFDEESGVVLSQELQNFTPETHLPEKIEEAQSREFLTQKVESAQKIANDILGIQS